MKKIKKLICRFCGEDGFLGKKEKNYGGETYYTNKNELCDNCKNIFIDDYDFSYWKKKNLIVGNQLNKRLKQIYKQIGNFSLLTIQDIHELYLCQKFSKDYSDEFIKKRIDEKKNYFKPKKGSQNSEALFNKTSNSISKSFNLIPNSLFGVGFYILIILFFAWILGDYGGDCGVDYAPRFFGEC